MKDKSSNTEDNKKMVSVTASDLNRVMPKLASKVLLSKIGGNTVLTFTVDLGDDKSQVIETIALDPTLHEGLIQILQDDLKEKEGKK